MTAIKSQAPQKKTNDREFRKPPTARTESNPFGLTARQLAFVNIYLSDPTGTLAEAARKAGYSKQSQKNPGHLMKNEWVQQAIDAGRKTLAKKTGVTAELVIKEIAKIAFGDLGKFIKATELGDPYWDFTGATPEELARIDGLTTDVYTEGKGAGARQVKKVKIDGLRANQLRALEMLMRHFGQFNDKVKLDATDVVSALQAGRKRVREL